MDTLNKELNMLKMVGFDHCIVGIMEQYGSPDKLAYDYDLVIKELIEQGMTIEDAQEFYEYNQLGAYMGPGSPCFLRKMSLQEIFEQTIGGVE